MCKEIFVYVTTADGERRADIPGVGFKMPTQFTPEKPICTCYIGDEEGEGKTLRQTFVEEVLRPLFQQVSYGNIVIEFR